MKDTVISVEGLSKRYQLGEVSTGTLVHDLNRWWHRIRGLDDPYSLVGRDSLGVRGFGSAKTDTDHMYALRDVNFDVGAGEVLGIIGRNGAGKSTLLKILSRITAPTTGIVKVKGRIASLLEVGTGFHPELTGRQNIFLNGAILGMTRAEIRRRFDAIVDFSGCGLFVDTPVKRYSSGMYVRLAFAVAAHLEPEILIVDEVLAVGDFQFQKKCLGKMNEVATNEGRTILFVSHNISAIRELCPRAMLLRSGTVGGIGSTAGIVAEYYAENGAQLARRDFKSLTHPPGDSHARLLECELRDSVGKIGTEFDIATPVTIGITYEILTPASMREGVTYPQLDLYGPTGELLFQAMAPSSERMHHSPGVYVAECVIPARFLNTDTYRVGIGMATCGNVLTVHFYEQELLTFLGHEDLRSSLQVSRNGYGGPISGLMRPALEWRIRAKTRTSS